MTNTLPGPFAIDDGQSCPSLGRGVRGIDDPGMWFPYPAPVVYVLTSEPYHENSTVMGVYRTLEAAQAAWGPVGPCRCIVHDGTDWTTHPKPGREKHQQPGWSAEGHVDGTWSTTCETAAHDNEYAEIRRFAVG